MKTNFYFNHDRIDANLKIPKYKQIVNSIIADIEDGILKHGQRIPSINETSEEYYLSRDTVEKAYNELRERGIITSVRGKGYYINCTDVNDSTRVLLVFNKLSTYKKIIYNALVDVLGVNAVVDLHIHHCNVKLFESIITNNLGNYTHYVIMPHFYENVEEAIDIIKKIPKEKLLILDKDIKGLGEDYAAVYQDFEIDIHQALLSGEDLLNKYHTIKLVHPQGVPYPQEIRKGFKNFCVHASMYYEILDEIKEQTPIRRGEAYIVIEETDLANLIKKCRSQQLEIGKDVGIISYNETPLKEILSDGITVISTDHKLMGEVTASMILNKQKEKIKCPFELIRRKSL